MVYICDICGSEFNKYNGIVSDYSDSYRHDIVDPLSNLYFKYTYRTLEYVYSVKDVCENCLFGFTEKELRSGYVDLVNESYMLTNSGSFHIDFYNKPTVSGIYPYGSDLNELKNNVINMLNILKPKAAFHSDITTGYRPLTVNFFDDSTNYVNNWFWLLGNGSSSNSKNCSTVYDKAGTYSVVLEVNNTVSDIEDELNSLGLDAYTYILNKTSYDSIIKYRYINVLKVLPEADFEADIVYGNRPLVVNFSENCSRTPTEKTPDYIEWYIDNKVVSNSFNHTYTFTKAGRYTVSLKAFNEDGFDYKIRYGYINVTPLLPKASFEASSYKGKAPLIVNFTDTSTGLPTRWYWKFDNYSYSAKKNPTYTFKKAGIYDVYLQVSNQDGVSTISKKITVIL